MKKVLLAGAVLAALTACSNVGHGTITSKEYIPARTWFTMEPVYSQRCTTSYITLYSKGQYRSVPQRSCTTYISTYAPEYYHTDACWELHLKNSAGDTGEVCIGKQDWEKASPGKEW